jgi:hypothetical protein
MRLLVAMVGLSHQGGWVTRSGMFRAWRDGFAAGVCVLASALELNSTLAHANPLLAILALWIRRVGGETRGSIGPLYYRIIKDGPSP